MCNCKSRFPGGTVNNTPGGYAWNDNRFHTYNDPPISPREGEDVVFDEPGRCSGARVDSHSHHLALMSAGGRLSIVCRHGGGEVRYPICERRVQLIDILSRMTSDERYWFLLSLWSAMDNAAKEARIETCRQWERAAIEKRIRVRRRKGMRRAEVLPRVQEEVTQ